MYKHRCSDIATKTNVNLVIEDFSERVDLGDYSKIPFTDIDKLKCNGRHIIAALWILRHMDAVLKRRDGWFYVDPCIVERYGTNRKDWYRCIKQLVEMGIIKIRLREGPYGRNLYCFPENY